MKIIASRRPAGYKARVQAKREPVRAPVRPGHSESTEDHLERIAELVDHKGYARVTDVAEALGLTSSTVSNMVRRLAARGFVNYERYRGFSLTSQGRAVAARIKARHETLTELFGLLGLEPETVEQEVEARLLRDPRGTVLVPPLARRAMVVLRARRARDREVRRYRAARVYPHRMTPISGVHARRR